MQWPSAQPPSVWVGSQKWRDLRAILAGTLAPMLRSGADLGCRVVGRHMLRLVAEEKLAVLEADPGHPETMAIGVLEVVHANGPKSGGARAPELTFIACSSASPRAFPTRVVDVRHGTAIAGEDELRVPAPATSITDRAIRFSTT